MTKTETQDLKPLIPTLEKMRDHYQKMMEKDPKMQTWIGKRNPCLLCEATDLLSIELTKKVVDDCSYCLWTVLEGLSPSPNISPCMGVIDNETVTQAFHRCKRWIKQITEACK